MKFEDYMALKEDFNTPSADRKFGDPTPTSKSFVSSNAADDKPNKFQAQADMQNLNAQQAMKDVKEACEYIVYVAECFGLDKMEKPEGYGLDTAVNALNKFAAAGDGKNISVPSIDKSLGFKKDENLYDIESLKDLKEACEYILSSMNEEAKEDDKVSDEELCTDDDDFPTVEGDIDTNTILTYPKETDQFVKSSDIAYDDTFNNSNSWDGDWD